MADETIDDGDSAAAQQVAAELRGLQNRQTISDEQRLLWQLEFEAREKERRFRIREARAENHRAEIEAAARAEREAAIAAEQHRQRVNRDIMERGQSQRQLTGIYDRLRRAEDFRNHAVMLSRQHAAQQSLQATIADLEVDIAKLNPAPPPQPQVIVQEVEPDDDRVWYSPDPNKSWF
jgi:outer membrane translocation and assembly module TamA